MHYIVTCRSTYTQSFPLWSLNIRVRILFQRTCSFLLFSLIFLSIFSDILPCRTYISFSPVLLLKTRLLLTVMCFYKHDEMKNWYKPCLEEDHRMLAEMSPKIKFQDSLCFKIDKSHGSLWIYTSKNKDLVTMS